MTLVHDRGQVYAIPCLTGKYTGWKCTITHSIKGKLGKQTLSQNFLEPKFSKTLVLVKSMILEYRPRLNHNVIDTLWVKYNRISIAQTPGLIFQNSGVE